MMRLALILVCALCVILPRESFAEKEFRVVIFGDSLASGYTNQVDGTLPAKLERKIRSAGYNSVAMVNLSKAEATTSSAIKDVDLVKQQLPDVIVIMLGMADISQSVAPQIVQANLDRIITSLKSLGAYIILVGIPAPKETGELYQYQIQMAYYNLAKGHGVPFYYSALAGIEGNPDYTLADGYHPNAQGVDIMVDGLFPYVDIGLRWRYDIYVYNQENQRNAPSALVFPQP